MLTADQIIDRRRLRQKVTFWRIVVLFVLFILGAVIFRTSNIFENLAWKQEDHIANVAIYGHIVDDRYLLELLDELAVDDKVKAVVLSIDSPGGSVIGAETLYEAIRNLSDKKPVVSTIKTIATSAAYIVSLASDHIVSHRSSIVGSIGVLIQYTDISTLLDKLGIRVGTVKSSPLKAEPSPFNPTTQEERQMLGRVIKDSYKWFVDIVAKRRSLSNQQVLQLADGSIYTGSQAKEKNMVDEIGGEKTAIQWLANQHRIDKNIKVIERVPNYPEDNNSFGIFGVNMLIEQWIELKKLFGEYFYFGNGLTSVWRP